jgi:putative FmdB family regulatory protein
MPIYEYKCEKGHTFEVMQRMADGWLEKCTVCGAPVQRVFHPIAVHFKGSGFYNTDYGKQKVKGNTAESDSSSSDSGSSDSKSSDSGSSDSGSSESKSTSDKGSSSSDGAKSDKKASKKAPTTSSKS